MCNIVHIVHNVSFCNIINLKLYGFHQIGCFGKCLIDKNDVIPKKIKIKKYPPCHRTNLNQNNIHVLKQTKINKRFLKMRKKNGNLTSSPLVNLPKKKHSY